MSFKYIALVIALSIMLIGCGSELPQPSSVNCAPPGMERALPKFSSEAERQAFIDGCKSFKEEE